MASNRSDRLTGQIGALDWSSADWLQQRIEHYLDKANDMCEAIEDLDDLDKLGQGFMSADQTGQIQRSDRWALCHRPAAS